MHFELTRSKSATYRLGVALADTFSDHLLRTFFVARVLAVLALTSCCVEQKLATERAADDLVELTRDELVSVDLAHILLAFAESALTAEASIVRTLAHILLDCRSEAVDQKSAERWHQHLVSIKVQCTADATHRS